MMKKSKITGVPIFYSFEEFIKFHKNEHRILKSLCEEEDIEFPVYMTSGGYDPIHPGHISVIRDMAYRNILGINLVVVNGDEFLRRKKGTPFMPQEVRCEVVASLRHIDAVLAFNPVDPTDMTVCEALEKIKPDFFCKGGDRKDIDTIPEWQVCQDNGIEIITGLGDDKLWSSSSFLKDWTDKCRK